MKFITILVLIIAVPLCTVTSSPIKKDGRGVLINRPTKEEIFNSRIRRSDTLSSKTRRGVFDSKLIRSGDTGIDQEKHVKGVKGISETYELLERNLRKGEYMCGGRVCELKPGEVPKNCKGCQYHVYRDFTLD